jgi:DNA-binding transcriptional ArsR family regulator
VNERQLLKIAKALSDSTRLRLLREIAASGEISYGELANRFPVAQPIVSHHLKVLEQAGLVAATLDALPDALGETFSLPVPAS